MSDLNELRSRYWLAEHSPVADEYVEALQYRLSAFEFLVDEIVRWSKAYPLDAFPELSKDEWIQVTWALEAGVKIDRVSASNMRHVIATLMQYIPENHTAVEK